MKIIRPLFKLGIASGAVYFTVDRGLWKNQEETIAAYKKLQSYVPGAEDYIKKIPTFAVTKSEFISYWNSGVKICFSTLASLPTTTKNGFWKGIEMAKEAATTK